MQSSLSERSRRSYPNIHKSIFIFWSAMLVQSNNCVPVYAYTLRCLVPRCCRVSASTGASWLRQHFIFAIAVCRNLVNKPDCNGKPTAQRGLGMKSGTKPSQELLNICFPKKYNLILRLAFIALTFKNFVQVDIHQ